MPETAPRRGGEIVRTLRREARKTAARSGLQYIVIDGPAGIGSTAIASVVGVSLAVVIAEPTISGLADLRRAIDLLGRLNIRTAAVINKCDLNPGIASDITDYLNGMGVDILGSISHSDQVSRADALGEFAVDLSGVQAVEEIKSAVGRTMTLAGAVT
jgi:MinD superfamily P-loop ATPase